MEVSDTSRYINGLYGELGFSAIIRYDLVSFWLDIVKDTDFLFFNRLIERCSLIFGKLQKIIIRV